jgi:hypothetical protein
MKTRSGKSYSLYSTVSKRGLKPTACQKLKWRMATAPGTKDHLKMSLRTEPVELCSPPRPLTRGLAFLVCNVLSLSFNHLRENHETTFVMFQIRSNSCSFVF